MDSVTPPNYPTGQEFLKAVDDFNQYVDKRANAPLIQIIYSEVRAYGDALRFELHNKLEKTVKAAETERMQSMSELERRINNSIAENTRKDKIRFRWVMGAVLFTLVNTAAVVTIWLKVKGL